MQHVARWRQFDLVDVDVTMPQARCLMFVALNPAISISALAAHLRIGLPAAWEGFIDMGGFLMFTIFVGTAGAVQAACEQLGGDSLEDGEGFWQALREHRHPFFREGTPLWRLSLAPDAAPAAIPGDWLYEWGGAQRWLKTEAPAQQVRELARRCGGHATLFRSAGPRDQVFQLSDVTDKLNIPVLAYGLRTDFQGELFEGSRHLLAWADRLEEIKTICHTGRKATMVVRVDEHGYALREGSQVEIGGNERYISVSRGEFKNVFYGGKRIRLIDPLEAGDGDAPVGQMHWWDDFQWDFTIERFIDPGAVTIASGATLTGKYLSAGIREILAQYEPVSVKFRNNPAARKPPVKSGP